MRRFSRFHSIVWIALFGAWSAAPLSAQLGPGPFAAFPTANETDGRFLGFGCPGIATFEAGVSITLSAGPGETDFTLNVFDGDTTGTAPAGHWDVGTRQLLFKLYFDPFRQGNTNPADLVGQWTGNAANPLTNPIVDPDKQWSVSAAVMPDNDWWGVTVLTSPLAQASPGGNFFYHLRIDADGACVPAELLEANIKVAASAPLSFAAPRFAFVAALRQIVNDRPIIYPGTLPPPSPPPPGGFVNAPTTFDGTFTFAVNIPPGTTELDIFDGDFDHGTNPAQLVGTPSGTPLFSCADSDDINTPADYSDFPPALSTAGAANEGAVAFGAPPDDSQLDLFRRGEPGAAGRVGCVRYEVTDPLGAVYRNDEPSSNLEWERFRIISQNDPNATVPGTYDALVASPFLPPGTWKVRIVALDMSNLNFFFVQAGVCSNIDNEEAFPELNFDRDAAGTPLAAETLIAEQWASQGVHFSTNSPVLHPLQILDSADPLFDPELGTPNEDFGGPGIGAGGGLGQPGENSIEQGNILIITESTELPASDFPGTVFVTFDAPKMVEEVHLIDIDGNGGTMQAFDAPVGGALLGSFPIANLGVNSFQIVALNLSNVRRLEIVLPAGGGIARITSGEDFVTNCPPPVFAIGDTVWYDSNGSALQSAGEVGVPGVLMELLAVGDPAPIATAVTGDTTNPNFNLCQTLNTTGNPGDEAGLYCFLVPPGDYTVRVAASNFNPGGPLEGLASTTGGETQTDTVTNANVLTYDFGYRGAGSIGDRVWLDTNSDGVQDGGETGINGVTVELRDGGGNLIATEVTSGDGNYLFENLPPGDYTVTVVSSTLPAGLDATFDIDGLATLHTADVTLGANENKTDVDFGYRGTASLGDRVWFDLDGDGVQDGGGEVGINGVTVRLFDGGGNLVATQVTAGDGLYSFTGLGAGTYTVRVDATTLPAGVAPTFDLDGIGSAHEAVATLGAGENRTDVDFGYRGTASLGDRVWLDLDGDGVQDGGGEVGINGVTVELLDGGGNVIGSQVTAGDGNYSFTNLDAGTYSVRVVTATLPAGLAQTFDLDGLGTPHIATASLAAGQNRTDVDFGYRGTASIGDRVWADPDGDGVQDLGEAGINGVTVRLLDAGNNVIATQITSGDGNYLFTGLGPGTYTVEVLAATLPGTFVQTFDLDGLGTPDRATATLAVGQNRTDVDFGYCPVSAFASIGDRIWNDLDGDGVQDGGEVGINGVTVRLLDAGNNLIATQVTAGDGNYSFGTLIAGTYTVEVVTATLPAGFVRTFDLDGLATPHRATATLAVSQNRTDVDFGYRQETGGTISLGDRVWYDNNGNGVQDGVDEPGINGVTVRLKSSGGTVIATQVTAGDGNYLFTGLAAGTYTVEVDPSTLPGGLVQTFDLDGLATQNKATAAVAATRLDFDFGYAKCKQCSGGLETLQLLYLGTNAQVKVIAVSGTTKVEIFNQTVATGGTISLAGPGGSPFWGMLGDFIEIFIDGVHQGDLWVSCKDPIGPGLLFTDSFLVLGAVSKNGGPVCPVDDEWCVFAAEADAAWGASGNHAFWLPGISEDLVFHPEPGGFTLGPDGTAHLTGTLVSLSDPNKGFTVDMNFTGLTTVAGAGSPKKELDAAAYKENGGPIDTNTWAYYTGFSGKLIGTGAWAGADLDVVQTGSAFQIGLGANNKNLHFGGSGWFSWDVWSQPSSGGSFPDTGLGDINIDFGDCPKKAPTCVGKFGGMTFQDKQARLRLYNDSDVPMTISYIYISWPPQNNSLKQVRAGSTQIWTGTRAASSTEITGGWINGTAARTIAPWTNKQMRFYFSSTAQQWPDKYYVYIEFEEGCSVEHKIE